MTAITLPPTTRHSVFLKFTPRKGMDFSLGTVGASAQISAGEVSDLKIVLGSISSAPIKLDLPVGILEAGNLSDDALDKALPLMRGEMGKLTNLYARAGYKKQIARSLVRRAIEQLREYQHG